MAVVEGAGQTAVAIDEVQVVEGFNPRTEGDDRQLAELAQSIAANGVLQPVLVRPGESGGLELVAGHRRLAAAKLAGLSEIPVHVMDLDGMQLIAATTENVAREDLTPLEEGRALLRVQEETGAGVRELGRMLGKGKDWVSDRLRLAKLPEAVQGRVAAGDIGLAAVPQLATIADALGPEAADAAVEVVNTYSWAGDLADARDAGRVVDSAVDHGKLRGVIAVGRGYLEYGLDALGLDPTVAKELRAEIKQIGPKDNGYGHTVPRKFKFDASVATVARKAGVLVELGDSQFVSDKAFIEKQARAQIAKWRKEPKPKAATGEMGAGKPSAAEARRRDRDAAERAERTAAARKANLELGKKLAARFAAPEITVEMARLIATVACDPDDFGADWIEALRLIDGRFQTVADDGSVSYAELPDVVDAYKSDLAAATSVEQILGLLLQVFFAAEFAHDPDRGYTSAARFWGEGAKQIAAVAKKARVVPKALTEARSG